MSHLNCDTAIIDVNLNRLVFFSVIGYSASIKGNLSKIKEESRPYAYMREMGTINMVRGGYEIEQKKQQDGDYIHAIGFLKDKITEYSNGRQDLSTYVYYKDEEDKNQKIYDKLYKNFTVPMISEWKNYIIDKLTTNRKIYDLRVVSTNENINFNACGVYVDNNYLERIIVEGLKNKEISIKGSNEPSLLIDSINGLNDYLNVFGETLASKIQSSFRPKFIPGEDSYSESTNDYDDSIFSTGIEMYEAQKSLVQATVNNLKKEDTTFVISEMGTGKSLMGAGAAYAHFKSIEQNPKKGLNAVILCPGHLTIKWKREVERFVPNGRGFIVKTIEDLINLEKRLRNKNKVENTYIIISKEDAKISYEKRPCAVWSERRNTYTCPHCGQTLKKKVKSEWIDFNETDMARPLAHNQRCNNTIKVWNKKERKYDEVDCNATLWAPLNKNSKDERWIKLGAEGWIQKNHLYVIKLTYESMKDMGILLDKKQRDLLARINKTLEEIEQGTFKETVKATRRYPLAKYIRENLKSIIDYAIIDECHLYKGDTEQGQAACDLMIASKKRILLTGTLLNGYADGLFYLIYRTLPRLMKKDGFEYNSEMEFTRRYGVTQSTIKTSKSRKNNKFSEKKLPGISPLVFTKFLLNNAVFLSMSDMSEGLPEYEEIPVGVELDPELKTAYEKFERDFSKSTNMFESGSRKIMGRMVQSLTAYADCPHMPEDIINPDTQQVVISPEALPKATRNKEEALLELVKEKINNNEKVLVYYTWVNKTDIGKSLIDLLKENDIDAREMKSSIKPDERELWVEKNLKDGMQVMICNPSLVETGLDLLEFTSIVFYQMGYNLFTMRQASRRSWRLSQSKNIKVYFMYYKDTIQEKAISLMATKLQASMALEGKFSEEGLRAMSNNEDMLTQIANSVVEGIKNTVDNNVFAASKFMKKERKGPRTHAKTKRMLEVKMDDFGMKEIFSLRHKTIKSTAKISKPVQSIISSSNQSSLLQLLTI
jgi:SNF2 family DNA or RNA helicase